MLSLMLVLLLFFRLRLILIFDINVDLFAVIDVDHNFVEAISLFCVFVKSNQCLGRVCCALVLINVECGIFCTFGIFTFSTQGQALSRILKVNV